MILKVMIGDDRLHGETDGEVNRIISKVMEDLDRGDQAWISVDGDTGEDGRPNNFLVVSLNRSTGYGGLVWFVDGRFPRQEGIYGSTWISNNPEPPQEDPDVITDLHCPVFLDRASAIPLAVVRSTIEEYWRTGTGDRPTCISWVQGHMNGSRADTETPVERISANAESAFDGLIAMIKSGEIPNGE